MQISNKHIINKLFLEVHTPSKDKAYYLKDNLDTFLKAELFPLLETYFDTLDNKITSHCIQIEKLNMDLSVASDFNFNTLKFEIMNQFQKQIEKQIDKGFPDNKNYTLIHNKEKSINAFFSFLETGTNPWWTISKNILNVNTANEFEKMISEKSFGLKILNALENRQTRIRFIKQLSDDQIYFILKKTFLLLLSDEKVTSDNSKIRENLNAAISSSNQRVNKINISRIKNNMKAVISKSKHGLHHRNLIWDIVLSELLKHNDHIIKEKLLDLIASFDVIKKYNSKFTVEHINKQIRNKSVLDILSNLENEVLLIVAILEQKSLEIIQKNKDEVSQNHSKTDESFALSNNKKEQTNSVYNNKEETIEQDVLPPLLLLKEETVAEIPANHYVNNAGLILIHPFLKQLFDTCKLLNKDNSINDPEVAAHLLHYIATTQEQDYENEMVIEKFLCSIPINQSINRNIKLPEEFKNHANEMLQAVLENWPAMKNSSVALLQNEYLQRPGKIMLNADNPKILVERKTQDILLEKINWNLGIVKLAWKNKVIFVEW